MRTPPNTQAEAVQLLQEMSMASDEALAIVRDLPDLVAALRAIASPGAGPLSRIRDRVGRYLAGASMVGSLGVGNWLDGARRMEAPASQAAVSAASKVWCRSGRSVGELMGMMPKTSVEEYP